MRSSRKEMIPIPGTFGRTIAWVLGTLRFLRPGADCGRLLKRAGVPRFASRIADCGGAVVGGLQMADWWTFSIEGPALALKDEQCSQECFTNASFSTGAVRKSAFFSWGEY